ncbi:MAG: PAS domain-containing protein, partial [Acidobacteriota bacterium]
MEARLLRSRRGTLDKSVAADQMIEISPRVRVALVGVLLAGGVAVVHLTGGAQPVQTLEFAAVMLSAIIASALGVPQFATKDRAIMPPSFVITFSALLLCGPEAALLVAAAGALTPRLRPSGPPPSPARLLLETGVLLAAAAVAGLVHRTLGGTTASFAWPWQGGPIVAAVFAYLLAEVALVELVVPLVRRRAVNQAWWKALLRGVPLYLVGASVAVGLVELIAYRAAGVVPVAALSLGCAYRMYADYTRRLEEAQHRHDIVEALDQGLCSIDHDGRIERWDDALVRLLSCPRDRALGRPLVAAVPALGDTDLPRAIKQVLADHTARTVAAIRLLTATDSRILQVKIVPVADGLSLVW